MNQTDSIFEDLYASTYDILYHEKNYEEEVDYLEELWSNYYDQHPESVLELGCGTGEHGLTLADRGYSVVGIDQSAQMTKQAEKKSEDRELQGSFEAVNGDIKSFHMNEKFDAVIAMFNVMGYINKISHLKDVFNTVSNLLSNQGVFVFDTWYGPAVLDQKPKSQFKKIKKDEKTVYRHSDSQLNATEHVVTVDFDVMYVNKEGIIFDGSESHDIRYFFEPEVRLLADSSGLSLTDIHPFLRSSEAIGMDTWNVTWVVQQ